MRRSHASGIPVPSVSSPTTDDFSTILPLPGILGWVAVTSQKLGELFIGSRRHGIGVRPLARLWCAGRRNEHDGIGCQLNECVELSRGRNVVADQMVGQVVWLDDKLARCWYRTDLPADRTPHRSRVAEVGSLLQ